MNWTVTVTYSCNCSVCKLQAVHSGADLQSAAASVLGYNQVSMKGKAIKVPPVPEVATAELKTLLEAVLPKADEEAEARLQGKAGTGGIKQTLTEVANLLAVRRALLPALTRGNKGCGGRLRYSCRQKSAYSQGLASAET